MNLINFIPLFLIPISQAFVLETRSRRSTVAAATSNRFSGLLLSQGDSSIENNRATSEKPKTNEINRKNFLSQAIITASFSTSFLTLPFTSRANAFDGGVGGLGKTKPETNVVFSNPDNIDVASSISTPGDYNAELVAPDGSTPAFLSFYAPWPMLRSSGIESRDLASSESAFVQVAPLPEGKSVSSLPKSFFVDTIFGQTGKYGMYGTPTDIKVKKVRDSENGSIYVATFTTLTPAMRESDRKALISASSVGGGVFMLVTGTTVARFKGQEELLNKVAESFVCVEAPKSSFRRQS
mmetsp:Transcript_273/g.415  ORF Transcript_273/g.415 Transcript_273/m.415 type:complete len:296 (+) Transcript_273:176-1063(+)